MLRVRQLSTPCDSNQDSLTFKKSRTVLAIGVQHNRALHIVSVWRWPPALARPACTAPFPFGQMDTRLLRPCHLPSRFVVSGAWGVNAPVRRHSRRSLAVRASLTGKGQQYSADLISVKKIMGEGAYGQVFEVFTLTVGMPCPH